MKKNDMASIECRTQAVQDALVERGLVTESDLDKFRHMPEDWKPENGAAVVARAWTDPEFRQRLLADATAACAELGYQGPQGEYIVALEDTPKQHNVIVCTQCSCTAWPVLGLPPDWYIESRVSRSRGARTSTSVEGNGLELKPKYRS